jgi:hypothetical protein
MPQSSKKFHFNRWFSDFALKCIACSALLTHVITQQKVSFIMCDFLCFFSFSWKKDDEQLSVSLWHNASLRLNPSTGSLTIASPNQEDVGTYQCFLLTPYGTAVGSKTVLKQACKFICLRYFKALNQYCQSPEGILRLKSFN